MVLGAANTRPRVLDNNLGRVKFIQVLDQNGTIGYSKYGNYDNFAKTNEILADQQFLGGSILRPLNTTSWMNIPNPFL